MARILIVEDDPDIAMSLGADLRRQGHTPEVVSDGEQAIEVGTRATWDLILLDVMLPRVDGYDVCRELRQRGVETPIIMLTARTQETEKEVGLDSGADDYVTKPFGIRELRARIRAQLRRSTRGRDRVTRFGDCEVDFDRAELRRGGVVVEVTPQEWRLLGVFLQHAGRALTRDQLISMAWGHGIAVTDRTVDTHVFNLRRKIEAAPSDPRWIVGVRGLGYRFELLGGLED
jgi:two-component system alkaline phosphatase synthesis response regulator PhoP/two-component system response regulator VicR